MNIRNKLFNLVTFLSAVAFAWCINTTSLAAPKSITFELNKEYKACQFSISIENKGNYTVNLVPPEGDVLSTQIIDGNICNIAANKVPAGTWTIQVIPDVQEVIAYDGEVTTVDVEVGQVKVSVNAATDATTSAGDIKIAKAIVGLKFYFINRTFHIILF